LHTVVFGVNLPKGYIKQAKVLKGGYQFSLRVAVPKWFFEDSYFKKQRGYEDDRRHLGVQAHCRQVIQPVCQGFNALETWILGNLQVINPPFQCVEGDYCPHQGNWATTGMQRVDGDK